MEFSFNHISLANLFGNGHNYITFSIMGMLIVFAGLSLISIYIALLPRVLNFYQAVKEGSQKEMEAQRAAEATEENELLLAIAVALHLDRADGISHEKITWERHEEHESAWLTGGRMRGLAVRSHLPAPRRQGE